MKPDTGPEITQAIDEAGAFFAFSRSQFYAKAILCVNYTTTPLGMICPVVNVTSLNNKLNAIVDAAIAKDIADNGIDAIITRELSNHEYGYTGDVTDTVEALEAYGITYDEVIAVARRAG